MGSSILVLSTLKYDPFEPATDVNWNFLTYKYCFIDVASGHRIDVISISESSIGLFMKISLLGPYA